jgi:membrane associated rhomboid family serine protease
MTPWVLRLLVANVVVFILQPFLMGPILNMLVLIPALVPYRPWTVITYQFLHAGFLHLLFNMIALFFFGPRLESRLGGKHFLAMYLLSGIAGATLSVFTPTAMIVGASGAVFGVLLGFARYWPRERIYIWGVLPVEARVLVIFLAALSLYGGISGGGNIAHFAHLGGFVGGWVYLKLLERNSEAAKFKRRIEAAQVPSRPQGRDVERWRKVDRARLHPLNREEFDRILSKAEQTGIQSVTLQERAFMERVSQS